VSGDATERVLLAVAAELEARIASVHERRACPRCGARVGRRCVRASTRGNYAAAGPGAPLKHPHRERWTQEVPER
jgi:hypothetical protein